jgi:hypothetical protein
MPVPKSGLSLSRLAAVFSTAVMLTLPVSLTATAQTAGVETAMPSKGFALTASSRINNFDWLATPRPSQNVRFVPNRLRVIRQLGTGSYICSPAGSGRKSRCYSN